MGKHITFGGYQPAASVHSRGVRVFAEALARITDGQASVTFDQDITDHGRKAADLFDLVETGAMDACYFSSSYLTHRVPELALFDQHFAVPSREQAYALLDGPLGERLAQEVRDKTGYIVLGYWDNGLRHISTAQTPLTAPEACEGMTLRTLASEDHRRIFRALGFKPTIVDVGDLQEAVQSGRVAAQENPLTNIFNFDLHKTHRTITLTGHLLGVVLVLFNAKTYASWPQDLQHAVAQAVAEATTAQRQFAQDVDRDCAEQMAKDGVTFVTLTPAQRAAFAEKTRSEVDATRVGLSADLIALFENGISAQPEERA